MLRLWLLTDTCQHLGLWPHGLWRRLARRLDRHHAPRLTMTTKRRWPSQGTARQNGRAL